MSTTDTVSDGKALIAELDARRQIHDALQRISRGIDRNDRDIILSGFHPGATDDHGEYKGSAEGFADYVAMLHRDRYVGTIHFLGNELFDFSGHGRYLDRWERRANIWRITERVVVFDSDRIDRVAMRAEGPLTENAGQGLDFAQNKSHISGMLPLPTV